MLYLAFFPFEKNWEPSLCKHAFDSLYRFFVFCIICGFCLELLPRLSVFLKKHSRVCMCLYFLADSIFLNYCKFMCESAVTVDVDFFFQSLATTSAELDRNLIWARQLPLVSCFSYLHCHLSSLWSVPGKLVFWGPGTGEPQQEL